MGWWAGLMSPALATSKLCNRPLSAVMGKAKVIENQTEWSGSLVNKYQTTPFLGVQEGLGLWLEYVFVSPTPALGMPQ